MASKTPIPPLFSCFLLPRLFWSEKELENAMSVEILKIDKPIINPQVLKNISKII